MNTNMVKRDNSAMNANPTTRPFGSLVSSLLGQDMGRWLDDEFWGLTNRVSPNNVPVNIRETDQTYEVEVMAPGLKKSDFKVSLDGKQLNISFEHKEEQKEGSEKEGYLRLEYRHQSFSRSFTLDDTVDANKIAATYTDGVLHLTVPKKEEAQRVVRTVEVK
jgi:HSP20 family protein